MKVVIDTSVFIDFSRAQKGLFVSLVESRKHDLFDLYIPTIVLSEFWAGQDMRYRRNVLKAEKMFTNLIRVDLDEKIAKISGELIRKNYIHGFDALIAATGIHLGAQVATQNARHFEKVPGLKLFKLQNK